MRKHRDPGSPAQSINYSLTRPDSATVTQPLTQAPTSQTCSFSFVCCVVHTHRSSPALRFHSLPALFAGGFTSWSTLDPSVPGSCLLTPGQSLSHIPAQFLEALPEQNPRPLLAQQGREELASVLSSGTFSQGVAVLRSLPPPLALPFSQLLQVTCSELWNPGLTRA